MPDQPSTLIAKSDIREMSVHPIIARDKFVPTQGNLSLAQKFHALFAGCARAHGCYGVITPDATRSDGKMKGQAVTLREPVTDELWQRHLSGTYGLGVIPIRDDGSTCVWGCIDIDVYDVLDHGRVASTLARLELPLVPCRSKSGGLHLFLFCAEPVPASQLQKRLQEIAARLGYGTSEINPKQTTIRAESQDLGSYLFTGLDRYINGVGHRGAADRCRCL